MALDWIEAARLVAAGRGIREIVAAIGCSRSQLHRRRTGCPLFRALVAGFAEPASGRAAAHAARSSETARSIEAAVRRAVETEISEGNLKVALWLADRLRLFTPEASDNGEEAIRRLLDSMTPEERAAFSRMD